MQRYSESTVVTISVNMTDLSGAPIIPTGMSAIVLDGEDTMIEDLGSITLVGGATQSVVVPSQVNEFLGSAPREARTVVVTIQTATGEIKKRFSYILESESNLVLMQNSFQTLVQAEIASMSIFNLSGWKDADDAAKSVALANAFDKITAIPMCYYSILDDQGVPDENSLVFITRDAWAEMTDADFNFLPSRFQRALRRAQLMEANEILSGDTLSRKIAQGIISETVGQSSVTLDGKKLNFGISSAAMNALAGYVRFDYTITRR